jgi:hypothetical protein
MDLYRRKKPVSPLKTPRKFQTRKKKNLVTLEKLARSREQGFETHPTCQHLLEEIELKPLRYATGSTKTLGKTPEGKVK